MIDLAKIQNSKFLVTGGAGFVGSHIAEFLLKSGAPLVRVIDNFITGQPSNIELLKAYPNFEFIQSDIRDIQACLNACEGMDYVSHQAALGSVPRSIENPIATNEHNVIGFLNMIKAAVDKGIKQMVYASSSSVYGDEPNLPKIESRLGNPLSPYAVSKKTNELYANVFYKTYGLKNNGT